GVLYVLLLIVLWLFGDLMVHRGQIPGYENLSPAEAVAFDQKWEANGPDALDFLGLSKARGDRNLAFVRPSDTTLSSQEQRFIWRAYLVGLMRARVGGAAAIQVLPTYRDLPDAEKQAVVQSWLAIPEADRQSLLAQFGFSDARRAKLLAADPGEHEVLWSLYLYREFGQFESSAAGQAADILRDRLLAIASAGDEAAPPEENPLDDHGILSLVVRTHLHDRYYAGVVDFLARYSPWLWKTRSERWGNSIFYLAELFLVAVVLAFAWALAMYLTREMAARAVVEATTRLRRAVYHHTFRLGTLAFRALGPSEAVTVFTRHVEAVSDGLYNWITVTFREPVKFGLLLAFALIVNWKLALAFLLFAFLVWMIGGQIVVHFRREGRAATNQASERLTLIRESLMLMRLVKCYLMELFNQSRVERQLARYAQAQRRRFHGEAIYRPLLGFLGTLAAVVLLALAGLIVLHGDLGVAGAIALSAALVSLYWPMTDYLEHRRTTRRAKESAALLFAFLDRPGEVGQAGDAEFLQPLTRHLEFDNVSLREPGSDRTLLQDVSFTVKAGQRVAIVGPDDLEKHALVYLIPRLLDPNAGEIRVDDHNLRWVTLDSLRAQVSLVLQHNLVFHDSVANNISCGDPAYTLPQVIEAAKVAHAHQFIQKLPNGYETVIGELGHELNVGQQYRIALARAIIRDPALLVIEEPEQQLDEDTKSQLDDTMIRILPGRTAIFLPHRISTIRSCDQILFLHKSRVEAAGIHRELLSSNPLYRHLHYLEFAEVGEQV
ncbi:MAG TPA: ABC transporter ATP-binding protein, partial [Gemmataceae bacterium]|nr:ABC transporter ATP-binding protein [Gemmataceae bacterium]